MDDLWYAFFIAVSIPLSIAVLLAAILTARNKRDWIDHIRETWNG